MPAFAARVPGRAAVVLWGSVALPPELRFVLDQVAATQGLEPVGDVGGDNVLAYRTPDEIEIGWPTLADSTVFAQALRRSPAEAPHLMYLDLQQLVEVAVRIDAGPRMVRERLVRGLALHGLQSALLAVTPDGEGWVGRGAILTSGIQVGLPGLLTSEVKERTFPPVLEPGAVLQVEAFFDPEVAEGVVTAVTAIRERSILSGLLAGPARALDQIARQLGGRTRLAIYEGGGVRAAVRGRGDNNGLLEAMEQLAAARGGPPPESMQLRDGWLVVSAADVPEWKAPAGAATEEGPFLWIRSARIGQLQLTLELRRQARDAVAVELKLVSVRSRDK